MSILKYDASVVVPVFNSQDTIKPLIDCLISQDYPKDKFEIIVVDDGSTDFTANILSLYPVTYLHQKNFGAGLARNKGAAKARGKIIIFVDSDCLVDISWVRKHIEAHRNNPDIGIIGGGVKNPQEDTYIAWVDFLSSWFNAHEGLNKHFVREYLPTLNLSVKKKVFKGLGGFWDKRLTGEDVDFCFRARQKGVQIQFDPALALWHRNPGLKGCFKHYFNWGYHASDVRGRQKGLSFHFLLSAGLLKSIILFLPIACGYNVYLGYKWWSYQRQKFFLTLPLLFLGRFVYSWGFVVRSWEKSMKK